MKKLISGLLAAIMVASVSTAAFADSENEQYDMTPPGQRSGLIVLRGDPSNLQHGGFKIKSGNDNYVKISFPSDYVGDIGETTVSVTNDNPDLLKIALVDKASGSYLVNNTGDWVTISGTTFTRTSSTQGSIDSMQATGAQFMAIGIKTGTATLTCTYTPVTGSHAGQSFTEKVPFEIVGTSSGNNASKTTSTVFSNSSTVKVDTGKKLTVKAGKTYQFKITSSAKSFFVSGNSKVFKVTYNGKNGNNYFYKVKAVGKVGQSTGFYLNSSKAPVTVGTIG